MNFPNNDLNDPSAPPPFGPSHLHEDPTAAATAAAAEGASGAAPGDSEYPNEGLDRNLYANPYGYQDPTQYYSPLGEGPFGGDFFGDGSLGDGQAGSYPQAGPSGYSMPPAGDASYYYPTGEGSQVMYGQMAGPNRGLPHQSRKDRRRNRNYTPEQLAHRREQNRKSQRAFRDRKEQRIKELEQQISEVDQETEDINSALEVLQAEYQSLLESKENEKGKGKRPEKST